MASILNDGQQFHLSIQWVMSHWMNYFTTVGKYVSGNILGMHSLGLQLP